MVEFLIAALIALYGVELLWFRRGIAIASGLPRDDDHEPTVSVIIAARNEEAQIAECLHSLRTLRYAPGRLEILLVDDSSTDRTAEIAAAVIGDRKDIRLIKSPPESGNLRGKTNAIAEGIRQSKGEILMFTDADCRVGPEWVRGTVRYFEDGVGIVGGFTILSHARLFHAVQALDWMYLFGIAAATSGLGIPLTAIGNNLSVRRTAYLETGGYEKIPFSVTEDYSLVQTILQKTGYRMRFPLDPETLVASRACDTVAQLFRQKQRWGVGALDMIPVGMAVISLGWLARAAGTLALFVFPLAVSVPLLAVVGLADFAMLSRVLGLPSVRGIGKYFLPFELYLTAYGLMIPALTLLSRNVVWKERTLRRGKKNALPGEGH